MWPGWASATHRARDVDCCNPSGAFWLSLPQMPRDVGTGRQGGLQRSPESSPGTCFVCRTDFTYRGAGSGCKVQAGLTHPNPARPENTGTGTQCQDPHPSGCLVQTSGGDSDSRCPSWSLGEGLVKGLWESPGGLRTHVS